MNKSVLIVCLTFAIIHAKPATNDQLDKATVNDVSANAVVSPDNKSEAIEVAASVQPIEAKKDGATVHISGISTGANGEVVPTPPEGGNAPFKPQRTGTMFARFIDDIFQIPINVLQNVARLITSPFVQTKKDPSAAVPAA